MSHWRQSHEFNDELWELAIKIVPEKLLSPKMRGIFATEDVMKTVVHK